MYESRPCKSVSDPIGAAIRDRATGALLGLATGDALGTTVEFSPPDSFPPVTDITGGGPFGLSPASGPTTPRWPCASPRVC